MVTYKEIGRYRGYRFGSDGSVWTKQRRGPNPSGKLSDTWKQMTPKPWGKMGYFQVSPLNIENGKHENRMVHTLILEAFRGPRRAGMCARHFPDPDTGNNAIANLQWGTYQQNCEDRERDGNTARGVCNLNSKLSEEAVHEIRAASGRGCVMEMSRKFCVSRTVIWRIRSHRGWTHI